MKNTTNYKLKKPEGTDVVNVDDFNTNADIIDGKLKELETNEIFYAVATGSANNYAVTIPALSTLSTYFDGLAVCVKINALSTGASTLNVNGWGAIAIVDSLGNPITNGGLKANTPYTLRYNGVNFILQGKGGGGNVTADKLLIGTTATGDSGAVVGTMPNNGAINLTPGTTALTIPPGYTSGGTVATDPNLISGNILGTKSIFGVQGKASVVDTADATATAGQILAGVTGYKNGSKITGTIPSKASATITPGTTNQIISANQFLSGDQTILGDPELLPGNIVQDINLFGVTGTAPKFDSRYNRNGFQYWSKTTMGITTTPIYTYNVRHCNGKIYCLVTVQGSSGSSGYKNTMQIYDINTDTWATGPDMNSANGWDYLQMDTYGDKLYITGGRGIASQTSFNNGIIRYDTVTNTFSTITYVPTALYLPVTKIYNGKIYVFGGNIGSSTGNYNSSSTYVYDIASSSWSTVAGCPISMGSAGMSLACGYNGTLYAVSSSPYSYNISTNTWSVWKSPPVYSGIAHMGVYNDEFYVFNPSSSAYKYTVSTATWNAYDNTRGCYGGLAKWDMVGNYVYLLDASRTFYSTADGNTQYNTMRVYQIF